MMMNIKYCQTIVVLTILAFRSYSYELECDFDAAKEIYDNSIWKSYFGLYKRAFNKNYLTEHLEQNCSSLVSNNFEKQIVEFTLDILGGMYIPQSMKDDCKLECSYKRKGRGLLPILEPEGPAIRIHGFLLDQKLDRQLICRAKCISERAKTAGKIHKTGCVTYLCNVDPDPIVLRNPVWQIFFEMFENVNEKAECYNGTRNQCSTFVAHRFEQQISFKLFNFLGTQGLLDQKLPMIQTRCENECEPSKTFGARYPVNPIYPGVIIRSFPYFFTPEYGYYIKCMVQCLTFKYQDRN